MEEVVRKVWLEWCGEDWTFDAVIVKSGDETELSHVERMEEVDVKIGRKML